MHTFLGLDVPGWGPWTSQSQGILPSLRTGGRGVRVNGGVGRKWEEGRRWKFSMVLFIKQKNIWIKNEIKNEIAYWRMMITCYLSLWSFQILIVFLISLNLSPLSLQSFSSTVMSSIFFHFLIIGPVVYTLTVLTPLPSIIVRYLYTTLVCESVLFNTNLGISWKKFSQIRNFSKLACRPVWGNFLD